MTLSSPTAELAHLRSRLERIAVFAGLPSSLLDTVAARCPVREVPSGTILLRSGARNDRMFVLLDGHLSVHLGDETSPKVAELGAGETVGELSAIDQRTTSATVVARSDSTLIALDEAMLWYVCHASHAFSLRLMQMLVQRLRDSNSHMRVKQEQYATLKAVAERDALTGAYSRRWLDETLTAMREQHERDGTPLSIAVIDVDHFKRVNDLHGHQVGDLVLREVAVTLRANLRPTDFVARFGGEEFVVLFPLTPLTGAHIAAERLRDAVSRALIRSSDAAPPLSVTVSIGLAELRGDDGEASIFARADAALYAAKRNGRNRIDS